MTDTPITNPRWLNADQQQTWLALWSVAAWLPTRLDEQLKQDAGVNIRDYFTLAQISMAPDGKLTMTHLARLSDMSPSSLSHVVSRLEKRGWVERHLSPDDRRTNIAEITPAGREFIEQAAPGHAEHVQKLVFDVLDDDEAQELGRLLHKIVCSLDPTELPRV